VNDLPQKIKSQTINQSNKTKELEYSMKRKRKLEDEDEDESPQNKAPRLFLTQKVESKTLPRKTDRKKPFLPPPTLQDKQYTFSDLEEEEICSAEIGEWEDKLEEKRERKRVLQKRLAKKKPTQKIVI